MNTARRAAGSRRLLVLALASVIAAGLASRAAADDAEGVRQVTVRFADLDLSRPEGVATLYRRLRAAAAEVCWPLEGRDLASRSIWQSCMQRAVADAVTRINRPELYAFYNVRNRAPLPAATITARTAP